MQTEHQLVKTIVVRWKQASNLGCCYRGKRFCFELRVLQDSSSFQSPSCAAFSSEVSDAIQPAGPSDHLFLFIFFIFISLHFFVLVCACPNKRP